MKQLFPKFFSSQLYTCLLALFGSGFIAFSVFYQYEKLPIYRFLLDWFINWKSFAAWAAIYIGYLLAKWVYTYFVTKLQKHSFWKEQFTRALDILFGCASLLYGVVYIKSEFFGLLYTGILLIIFYLLLHHYLQKHPEPTHWIIVTRTFFILIFFLFTFQLTCQYFGYQLYILDSHQESAHIVLLRSISMTLIWLATFSLASILYSSIGNRFRYLFLTLWIIIFILQLVFWAVNIGLLYFSGLYLNPVALDHFWGSIGVVQNKLTYVLVLIGIGVFVLFIVLLQHIIAAHKKTPAKYWYLYHGIILIIGSIALTRFLPLTQTPEYTVLKSFYTRYIAKEPPAQLPQALQVKLQEQFGLQYDTSRFDVAYHERVFKKEQQLLPEQRANSRPNIIIVFVESLSARLSDVYNPTISGVTPGLSTIAKDPHTTIIKNTYNSSTPTITGIISQLCSSLPPTGHGEIEKQKKLQNLRLSCLPKILREQGGYTYAAYITSVEKEFANKDSLFASMGTDEIFGREELKQYIPGEELSWGFSDHQIFNFLPDFIETKTKSPFLLMVSTVDTHAPFTLAKDEVPYQDGNNTLLNAFHTTDDALFQFWNFFRESPLYKNTIFIVVADHAAFPSKNLQETFPDESKNLSYYDETVHLLYVPDSVLPKEVSFYSSGIDFAPTVLHLLNINVPNTFEGHSIFDDRDQYQNILGMHELGLYINQEVQKKDGEKTRKIDYHTPDSVLCKQQTELISSTTPLTLCEYFQFYKWKRQMLEQGRLWFRPQE